MKKFWIKSARFSGMAFAAVLTSAFPAAAAVAHQAPSPNLDSRTPQSWVEAAAVNEQNIIQKDGDYAVRYRVHKIDAKGDVTRDVIESRDGTVARLILRNGQPLTPTEDAAEHERLNAMLASPSDFAKHSKRDRAARQYSVALVGRMPHSMIFTYAPGQPQRPGGDDIVIDFKPDPAFKPSAMIENILTGLEGRMWIDRKSMRLTRIEGRVIKGVDFGWGVLAHIYPEGTVEFEQAHVEGNFWIYSQLREHLTIREMMFKTVHENTAMDATDFRMMPAQVSYQEAIRILLGTPLPQH